MSLTKEENQFVEFLESFPQFYWKAHKIAENAKGISILPMDNGKNEFKMYAWMKFVIHVKYSGKVIF